MGKWVGSGGAGGGSCSVFVARVVVFGGGRLG